MRGSVPRALVPLDTMQTMRGLVSHDFFNRPHSGEENSTYLSYFSIAVLGWIS